MAGDALRIPTRHSPHRDVTEDGRTHAGTGYEDVLSGMEFS
jgi:hypothetical protein